MMNQAPVDGGTDDNPETETRNDIGLSVSESKLLLNTVQQSVVQLQADEYTNTISGVSTALLRAESKANRKYGTDAVWRYSGIRLRVYRCRCEE